jgi:hypothetical protein
MKQYLIAEGESFTKMEGYMMEGGGFTRITDDCYLVPAKGLFEHLRDENELPLDYVIENFASDKVYYIIDWEE